MSRLREADHGNRLTDDELAYQAAQLGQPTAERWLGLLTIALALEGVDLSHLRSVVDDAFAQAVEEPTVADLFDIRRQEAA